MGRLPVAIALVLGLAPGCYRSHVRAGAPDGADAGSRDAASRDAPELDAGPIACRGIDVVATVLLDEGVTPRVAALGGDDVGVVYVRTDGSPTRVIYERLDRGLGRVTGPVTIATDSFTWAELAIARGDAWIAYGVEADRGSVLVRAPIDGAPVIATRRVPLGHPSLFQVAGDGFFWAAFATHADNALELSRLDAEGAPTHPVVTIPLGRYGSGHGALARDARSHVVTYPREGPPGERHGYLNVITSAGELGPERLLDPEASDRAVLPVRRGDELVIVRSSDTALVLERVDPISLETREQIPFPPIASTMAAGAIADRVVVAHAGGATLEVDDFGTELAGFERHEVAIPGSLGSGTSIAELPGALVVAITVNEGAIPRPWLVRVECAR